MKDKIRELLQKDWIEFVGDKKQTDKIMYADLALWNFILVDRIMDYLASCEHKEKTMLKLDGEIQDVCIKCTKKFPIKEEEKPESYETKGMIGHPDNTTANTGLVDENGKLIKCNFDQPQECVSHESLREAGKLLGIEDVAEQLIEEVKPQEPDDRGKQIKQIAEAWTNKHPKGDVLGFAYSDEMQQFIKENN